MNRPDQSSSLSEWLSWLEQLHPNAIDLGLQRVSAVYQKLPLRSANHKVLTIAGTNGKGTCARVAEALAQQAGLRSGCYTSPHLWSYNERIRINGHVVSDAQIVAAFSAVDAARASISLSYFEFGTLAAIWLFDQAELDLWILEVGLGGRLDAVNVVDADVAVVTSIGLDHEAWLGRDLDKIAEEKAAICRPGKPLLLGVAVPEAARALGQARGATVQVVKANQARYDGLPAQCKGLVTQNIELAIAALRALQCAPAENELKAALQGVQIPGRCQLREFIGGEEVLDVAHNVEAVAHLVRYLETRPAVPKTVAVFSALQDKPIEAMVALMRPLIDLWCIAPLNVPRGVSTQVLRVALGDQTLLHEFQDVASARQFALSQAQRVVTFGSFHTVEQAGQ